MSCILAEPLHSEIAMDSITKRRKNISDLPTNRFDNLPREVAIHLLSRLPVTSLMQFRFVSKSCKNLSFDTHLINLHRSRTAVNNTCLILHSSYPLGNQLHFVEFSHHPPDKEIARKIRPPFPNPALALEFNVVGSSNGLLCVSNSKNHDVINVFNPFTRSYKQLPDPTQFDHQKVLVGFGFHPLINEYKVVRIIYYQDMNDPYLRRVRCGMHILYSLSLVQVCSVGSNKWRSVGKMPYQVERWSPEPLLVNGRLHWLTRAPYSGGITRRIVSFDLADEQFREVPSPNWGGMRRYHYPFAALGGCLSMVVYPRDKNLEIWVMKDYGVVESWSKDFEIDVTDSNPRGPRLWSTAIQSFAVRFLCLTKSGGIMLMHDGALAIYDPDSRELKNVMFKGMPNSFQAIVHEGNLAWIEDL